MACYVDERIVTILKQAIHTVAEYAPRIAQSRGSVAKVPASARDGEERRVHEQLEHEAKRHSRGNAAAPECDEPEPAR